MAVMAKGKPPTESTYVRLPVDLKRVFEALAEEHRRPFSIEVAIALEKYLEGFGRWPLPEVKPPPPAEG